MNVTQQSDFKLSCDNCGSLAIALPTGHSPDQHEMLKCGRCGFPRGTLLSLRNQSIQSNGASN